MSSDRLPLVAGNWKMNTTVEEGRTLLAAVVERAGSAAQGSAEMVVLAPFVHLWPLHGIAKGSPVRLGAQDVFWLDAGAYTGEVSPVMLVGLCDYVLIGHSERRQHFGETDAGVNRRLRRVLEHGLGAIVAVGETETQRDGGTAVDTVRTQVGRALDGVEAEQMERCVIAYEPVWAIGTGRAATVDQAQEMCAAIRGRLGEVFSPQLAAGIRVLYGGSCTPATAPALFAAPDIDGALVGGASLDADQFAAIVAAASHRPASSPRAAG